MRKSPSYIIIIACRIKSSNEMMNYFHTNYHKKFVLRQYLFTRIDVSKEVLLI